MVETCIPRKIKLPSHVAAFRCAQCGECCTNKWRIDIDAVSFDKLSEKLTELGRQQELEENFKRCYLTPRFRFLPNGKCPYLSDSNLCRIQLELGEDYLFDICKVYPRHIFASPDALEFSLTLTCKAAVKTLHQEKIKIIETDWPAKEGQDINFSFIQPNAVRRYYPAQSPFNDARLPYSLLETRFIELVQDRRYTVGQRLVLLGRVLCRLLSESESPGGININECFHIEEERLCLDGTGDLKEHLELLFELSNIFLLISRKTIEAQNLRWILLSLSPDTPHLTETADKAARKVPPPPPDEYRQKLERYYQPAASISEGILENYLVNFVLSKSFYLRPPDLAFYRMAFKYAAAVAFCIGHSISANRSVDKQTVLQAVYDVENTFYGAWFYPYAAATHAGKSPRQILERGLLLAAI